jgi:hypothetical protein
MVVSSSKSAPTISAPRDAKAWAFGPVGFLVTPRTLKMSEECLSRYSITGVPYLFLISFGFFLMENALLLEVLGIKVLEHLLRRG